MTEQRGQVRGVSDALQAPTPAQSTAGLNPVLNITIPIGDTVMSDLQIPALDSLDYLDDILHDVDPLRLPPMPQDGLTEGEGWDFALSDCPLPTPSTSQFTSASQDDPFDILDYEEGSQSFSSLSRGSRFPPQVVTLSDSIPAGKVPLQQLASVPRAAANIDINNHAPENTLAPSIPVSQNTPVMHYFTTTLFPTLFPFATNKVSQAVYQYTRTTSQTSPVMTAAVTSLSVHYQQSQLGRFGIVHDDLKVASADAGRNAFEGVNRKLQDLKLCDTVSNNGPVLLEVQFCALLLLLSMVGLRQLHSRFGARAYIGYSDTSRGS
jgi:hypothetical protein